MIGISNRFRYRKWGARMSKLEQKKQKKLEALLENTLELFTSKGIQDTSISEIVQRAGVAKGTFYLYFKDKYDIRNVLIAHESTKVFVKAEARLRKENMENFEDRIIFLANDIVEQLANDKKLLMFISKNLSWGYFKAALTENTRENTVDFKKIYEKMLRESQKEFKDPEVMLFMIVELVSSTCYSSILYGEPLPIEELKPYLFETIRSIIRGQIIT